MCMSENWYVFASFSTSIPTQFCNNRGKTFEIIFGLFFADHCCCCFSSKYVAITHNTCAVCVVFDFALSLITFREFYEMRLKMTAKKVFVCLIQLPHIFAIKLSVHTPPHHSSSDSIDQKMMIACLQQMAVCEWVCRCIYKAHDTRLLTVQFSMLYRNLPYHLGIFQWKAANCLFHNKAAALVWSGVRVAER